MNAVESLGRRRAVPKDVVNQVMMAMDAVDLKNIQAHGAYSNRLREVLERETLGMPQAVLGLHEILGDGLMGDVAIVARGYRMVACLLPPVILFPHDVAVHTCLRVVAQV
jgi:hypothetical protein